MRPPPVVAPRRPAPSSIRTIRSVLRPTAMSCVTIEEGQPSLQVEPAHQRRRSRSAFSESRSPVGSSAQTIAGSLTSERAIVTRWRSPPESASGTVRRAVRETDEFERRERPLGAPRSRGLAPRAAAARRSRPPSARASGCRTGRRSPCAGRGSRCARGRTSIDSGDPSISTSPSSIESRPGQAVEQRRLAAARRAHDRHHLAALRRRDRRRAAPPPALRPCRTSSLSHEPRRSESESPSASLRSTAKGSRPGGCDTSGSCPIPASANYGADAVATRPAMRASTPRAASSFA